MDDLFDIEAKGQTEQVEAPGPRGVEPRKHRPAPPNGLVRSLERRRLQAYVFSLIADSAIILGTFYLISAAYWQTFTDWFYLDGGMLPGYLVLPLYLTMALANGTYSRISLTNWRYASLRSVGALVLSAILLILIAFLAKASTEFSRFVFATGTAGSIVGLTISRIAGARILSRHWGPSAINSLVVHAAGPQFTLPHAYHLSAEEHDLVPDLDDPYALDRLSRYLRNMDQVIVSCPSQDRVRWAHMLKCTGIHGEVVDEMSRRLGAIGIIHHDQVGISSLLVSRGELDIRSRAIKRAFDLAMSLPVLLLISPVLLLVALLIKLEDGGPIFFLQRRMGRGNRFFTIYKFRSMRMGDADGVRSASKDDERVTRIGKILRKTSIDELPQLLNVVLGDMSLVGPRPHALGSTAGDKLFWQVDAKYWRRHCLRPGITGLAQVRGYRGATDTENDLANRLQADLEYLSDWSIWRDIYILFMTARVLVHERAF